MSSDTTVNDLTEDDSSVDEQMCNCMMQRTDTTIRDCAVQSDSGLHCSLPEDHDGPHVACNATQHPLSVWNEADELTRTQTRVGSIVSFARQILTTLTQDRPQ